MFAARAEARNKEFRFRGKEPGRLETFSDACFALAITLLLISTSPPTNFDQVRRFVWELIPFTLCIVWIVLIWNEHFVFYYRYGLRNGRMIVLNTVFLVIVLFYVYPLKFLARLILIPISIVFGATELRADAMSFIKGTDVAELMMIFGFGAATVFFILMLMYRHALSKSEELGLNELEIHDTKSSVRANLLMGSIPLLSALLAIIFDHNPVLSGLIPGFTYFLYTPVMWIHGSRSEAKRNKILEGHLSSELSPSPEASNAGEPI